MLLPPYYKVNVSVGVGVGVTMVTELFMGTPDTVEKLKYNMNVLKESMNMQRGTCSGVFIDKS